MTGPRNLHGTVAPGCASKQSRFVRDHSPRRSLTRFKSSGGTIRPELRDCNRRAGEKMEGIVDFSAGT